MTADDLGARASEVEGFFHAKADRIDELSRLRWDDEVAILGTTTLDALAALWFHDFPETKARLESELGGTVSPAIRMSRLMQEFASNDELAKKVAVVCFAEDLERHVPRLSHLAAELLAKRVPDRPDGRLAFGELPRAHLDTAQDDLLIECPALRDSGVLGVIEEYTYPALLYRFFRCPMVHMGARAPRTHGFAEGCEVMYMRLDGRDRTSISFGPQLVTDWIRSAASGYVQACVEAGRRPANNVDAGAEHEERLERRWRGAAGGQ